MVSDKEDVTPNDDNICYEVKDGVQDVVTVTCDYTDRDSALRGRYVTIRRKENASSRHLMNFCEVEVLSCLPGFWGNDLDNDTDCSQSCGRCIEETCRVWDGYCYTECQDRYWGDSCNNDCDCPVCDRINGCTLHGESESVEMVKSYSP